MLGGTTMFFKLLFTLGKLVIGSTLIILWTILLSRKFQPSIFFVFFIVSFVFVQCKIMDFIIKKLKKSVAKK